MRKLFLITIGISLLFTSVTKAHNKVVVVPLGGGDFKYQNPLIIPAAEFRGDGNTSPPQISYLSVGAWRGVTGDTVGCVVAPIYLPDGATFTKVEAVVRDFSSEDLYISVIVSGNTQATGTEAGNIATLYSSGSSTFLRTITGTGSILGRVVDNLSRSYTVRACLPEATHRIYSMRIYFTQ